MKRYIMYMTLTIISNHLDPEACCRVSHHARFMNIANVIGSNISHYMARHSILGQCWTSKVKKISETTKSTLPSLDQHQLFYWVILGLFRDY